MKHLRYEPLQAAIVDQRETVDGRLILYFVPNSTIPPHTLEAPQESPGRTRGGRIKRILNTSG